jgi:signal transduction histidine kinase
MRAGSPQTYRVAVDGPNTLVQRLRSLNPLVVDTVLAVALAAITLIEEATELGCPCVSTADAWWTAFFMLTQTLPLAVRRRYPFVVFLAVGLSGILYNVLDIPPQPFSELFPILLAFYTVVAYGRRALAITSGAGTVVAMVVLNIPAVSGDQDFRDVITQFVLVAVAWFVGDNTRYRRRQAELLQERAERAEREREEHARLAALEERARIAREIHDVVAHSVSVIAIQAGAARTVVEEQPERAREALASIEEISRETMAELRRALGVLRATADDDLAPQPGLDRIDDLLGQFRRTGLLVTLTRDGSPREVPSGLDLSAYRVVQEALTNTLKHAGATAALVSIRYGPDALEVTVTDEGGAADRPRGNGSGPPGLAGGQGLIGMRERVAMFGGTLEAGATTGGFAVRARFPLEVAGEGH